MGAICGDVDEKTVQLLELVSQYEQLCNDKLRTDFADGFFTLGRANYNSGSVKKYGVDSLDMRPHEPSITVEVGDQLRVVRDDTIAKKTEINDEKDGKTNEDNELRNLKNEKNGEKSTLRNRKKPEKTALNPATSTKETKETQKSEKPCFNPLLQFGGLVPYQLRQSQLHFTAAIELAVERHNLAVRIEKLVAELESTQSN